ncbi:MAG: FAD-binding protein [Chloroflexi bacterium]|nr:FAD-binding protein [Chloroflexota bacterium]
MRDMLVALRTEIPGLRVLTDEIDRESYRKDEALHLRPGLPLAVALPRSTDEVASIVRISAAHRVPVVPRGAGSGLPDGSAGIEGALTRMNEILEMPPGVPVLCIHGFTSTRERLVCEFVRAAYRGDRYQLNVDLA